MLIARAILQHLSDPLQYELGVYRRSRHQMSYWTIIVLILKETVLNYDKVLDIEGKPI